MGTPSSNTHRNRRHNPRRRRTSSSPLRTLSLMAFQGSRPLLFGRDSSSGVLATQRLAPIPESVEKFLFIRRELLSQYIS